MENWKHFRKAGLLWFVNRILHVFGWAIVLSVDTDTGEAVAAYPMRVDYDGFSREDEIEGYAAVKAHLAGMKPDSDPKPADADTVKGEG